MARVQIDLGNSNSKKSDPGRSITLFLSLYLLVLAFFILLVSISTVEEIKSKALMQSLTSTFSTVLPPTTELQQFNSTTGEFLAADEFQRQITGLFSTVIGVEKIDTIQPGRLMRVELAGNGLFLENSSEIRENQFGFMDRLVAALSSSPPGLKFEMEFIAPAAWLENKLLPTQESLAISRAGSFANELLSRGAPMGSLYIGMKGTEIDTFELWFYVRATDENRIRFEDSPLINVPAPEVEEEPTPAPVTLLPLGNGGVSIELPLSVLDQPEATPENVPRLLVPQGQTGPSIPVSPQITGGNEQ